MLRTLRFALAGAVFVGMALFALSARADCVARLADIDKKLQALAQISPQMVTALAAPRDRAAAACAEGDEQRAQKRLDNVDMILATIPAPGPKAPEAPGAPHRAAIPDAETVYINSSGEGILRYIVHGGQGREYTLVNGVFTGMADMPIETLGSSGARYMGPDIAVWMWGITGRNIPIEKLALTLYDVEASESVALFRFVVDDARAEPQENCGDIDRRTDECSRKSR